MKAAAEWAAEAAADTVVRCSEAKAMAVEIGSSSSNNIGSGSRYGGGSTELVRWQCMSMKIGGSRGVDGCRGCQMDASGRAEQVAVVVVDVNEKWWNQRSRWVRQ